MPTNWAAASFNTPITIIGTGTDAKTGLPYIDIQWNGTTGSLGNGVMFVPSQTVPTSSGEQWSLSFYAAIVGGATTNVSSFAPAVYITTATGALNPSTPYYGPSFTPDRNVAAVYLGSIYRRDRCDHSLRLADVRDHLDGCQCRGQPDHPSRRSAI